MNVPAVVGKPAMDIAFVGRVVHEMSVNVAQSIWYWLGDPVAPV